MLLAIMATAAGLVLLVMMEPKIPSMTEVDLSKRRQWELIDEMVQERQKKWEKEGHPEAEDIAYDEISMGKAGHHGNGGKRDDHVYDNFDNFKRQDFDHDDTDMMENRRGGHGNHGNHADDDDGDDEDDWFKDNEDDDEELNKPELDFNHKLALEIDNDPASKPAKRASKNDKKTRTHVKTHDFKASSVQGVHCSDQRQPSRRRQSSLYPIQPEPEPNRRVRLYDIET